MDLLNLEVSLQSNAKEMWWEAEVDVQVDAVVINFVVQFYEHFDNNQGSDHKVQLTLGILFLDLFEPISPFVNCLSCTMWCTLVARF